MAKRLTHDPIDILDGFRVFNIGDTSAVDPVWETLFTVTEQQLPKGFYLLNYDFAASSTVAQKPIEAQLLYNDTIGTINLRSPVVNAGVVQFFSISLFLTKFSNNDLKIDFQFRNGTGGGAGAVLTVAEIQVYIQLQSHRAIVPPDFPTPSSQPLESLSAVIP